MNLVFASIVLLGLVGCSRPERATPVESEESGSARPQAASSPKATESPQDQHGMVVTLVGSTAIGFFPPTTQAEIDADDGGLREGMAHVQFALEDLEKCLAPRKVVTQFRQVSSLTIADGSKSQRIDFPPEAIGIVLAAPGKVPKVIYAMGPSFLIQTAPQAAWKYFSEPNCKRYEEPDVQVPPNNSLQLP